MIPNIITKEEAAGRTIEKILKDDEAVYIKFTDGSLLGFVIHRGQYDECDHITTMSTRHQLSLPELTELGYMTQEEAAREKAVGMAKLLEEMKQKRLQEWRKLDKEFNGTPPEPCKCAYCTVHGQGACKITTFMKTAP